MNALELAGVGGGGRIINYTTAGDNVTGGVMFLFAGLCNQWNQIFIFSQLYYKIWV